MRVALANCAVLPEPDPDAAPLLAALRASGVDAIALAWDDENAKFADCDLTLLRATWNYPEQPERFMAWVSAVSTQTSLWNRAEIVRWNLHKSYLLTLAAAGLPVIPTELVPMGSNSTLRELCDKRGFSTSVVKPAIGAGSFGTRKFTDPAAGEAHLSRLLESTDVLVQPYLPSVTGRGERSLIWIDGEVTHAVRKSARFAGESEHIEPVADITHNERAVAERAVAAVGGEVFYARVDLLAGDDGEPLLMELELIEPSLYFAHSQQALARFVQGTIERLR
jgi:glutathione synthase/RimK-type ligase-like ATP-grasp enzyme